MRIADVPRAYVLDESVDCDAIRHVLARYGTADALEAQRIESSAGAAGLSGELPIDADPVLSRLATRIEDILGFRCGLTHNTFRFRRYAIGDFHKPHLDTYVIGGFPLVATALVNLTDAAQGGETVFPDALPEPVAIAAKQGRLAIWFNHRADGEVERRSLHGSARLAEGEKTTLAYFVCAPFECAGIPLAAECGDRLRAHAWGPTRT